MRIVQNFWKKIKHNILKKIHGKLNSLAKMKALQKKDTNGYYNIDGSVGSVKSSPIKLASPNTL